MSWDRNSVRGQSLIELVVALGVGVTMLGVASGALFLVLRSSQLSQQYEIASSLINSMADNVAALGGKNWQNLYGLNKGSANHYYVATSTGQLAIESGDQQTNVNNNVYTVYFYIENVSRNASGNIESVYNALNDDPSTQKITGAASWSISGSSPIVTSEVYLTRWPNEVFRQTDWSGGAGQEGPITSVNNKFTSQTNVDFTTTSGSITPVTNNLVNIYVADRDNDRVQKFDGFGIFVTKWGTNGTGNGQFKKPYGVAIDSLNNVYVTDKDNDRVQKFDSSGNFLLKWGTSGNDPGEFGHPQGIAIDSANNIYIADLDNDRIQKFNSSGNFLLEWGSNGSSDGKFKKPQDVAVDSANNVYVADRDNDRVQKFDSSGNFLLKWGTNGTGNGQFKFPQGVGVDNLNNIFVADLGNDRIQKFDSNGNFLLKWGTNGTGNGQFNKPQSVTADQANNIYVSDGDNDRVQKFDGFGIFVTKWGTNGTGNGQFKHPQGLEYIPASCDSNCILISSVFDTGVSGGAALNSIMWQGNQPSGTAVKFQIASSNSSSGPWNYLGSDGSGAGYYAPAGPNVQAKVRSADHNNKRYFRYKAFFDAAGASLPRVDDVIINWSR
ncbi:MAG: 6-bladed beta-propeller [Candidatus Harrisonbacteria bacterium]|nr:6-bladed beta-propeller [Candidatus Harrisonbacteria bacterium]